MVGEGVDLPDQPVVVEDREREVAPAPLRRGLVHLEGVLELEQLLGASPVVDEPVERREERRPPLEVVAERTGIDAPLALHALDDGGLAGLADVDRLDRHGRRLLAGDAERGEPALVLRAVCLVHRRDDDAGGVDPLRQVPQTLAPGAPGDRDLAAQHEELEHLGHVAVVRPAGRRPRHHARVGDVARAQRARSCRAGRGCRAGTSRCRGARRACARCSASPPRRRDRGRGRPSAAPGRCARRACGPARAPAGGRRGRTPSRGGSRRRGRRSARRLPSGRSAAGSAPARPRAGRSAAVLRAAARALRCAEPAPSSVRARGGG